MKITTKKINSAEAAVIARARQLTDFRWTPLRDVPTYTIAADIMWQDLKTKATASSFV